MALKFPRFIGLQSYVRTNESLGFVHGEQSEFEGYLEFKEIGVLSPYANFEIEPATGEGKEDYVHIKSTQNHKYLVRTKNLYITNNPGEQYWITATAQRKNEDDTKESSTLYQFLPVDAAKKTFRITHVQSKCYLCLWGHSWKHVVLANNNIHDWQDLDVYRLIDLEPLTLPKYMALKGSNDQYLCPRQIQNQTYLQFATNDITDPTVAFEIFDEEDGNIRLKSIPSGEFWRPLNTSWILADDDKGEALFRPIRIDGHKIGLVNVSYINGRFCKRYTDEFENCLSANIPYIDEHAELRVEEPIKKREIRDVKYDLQFALFSEKTDHILATEAISNHSRNPITFDLKLSYKDTKTSAWDAYLSVKTGVKASFIDIDLPFMFKNHLKLSGKFRPVAEWGETQTTNSMVEVVYNVAVPPLTRVTVEIHATQAKYEVPCLFTQNDTLYNGSLITTEVERASYFGSNYYNFNFDTKEERLQN